VAYVGTQNRHQNYYTEINTVPETDLPVFNTNANCAAVSVYCPVIGKPPIYNLDVAYPGYHDISVAQNEANSDYNSIQMSFRGA